MSDSVSESIVKTVIFRIDAFHLTDDMEVLITVSVLNASARNLMFSGRSVQM